MLKRKKGLMLVGRVFTELTKHSVSMYCRLYVQKHYYKGVITIANLVNAVNLL